MEANRTSSVADAVVQKFINRDTHLSQIEEDAAESARPRLQPLRAPVLSHSGALPGVFRRPTPDPVARLTASYDLPRPSRSSGRSWWSSPSCLVRTEGMVTQAV